jgi:hypothetical protein
MNSKRLKNLHPVSLRSQLGLNISLSKPASNSEKRDLGDGVEDIS